MKCSILKGIVSTCIIPLPSVILFQPQKLVEEECLKSELVMMMFTED